MQYIIDNVYKFDYTKNPLRGIFTVVADRFGVTPQAVRKAFYNKNQMYTKAVITEINDRLNINGFKPKSILPIKNGDHKNTNHTLSHY